MCGLVYEHIQYTKMIQLNALSLPHTQKLPYHPDMPLWQYLREVIAPARGMPIHSDGVSITSCLVRHSFTSPSGEFRSADINFNYANRLLRLGDVVPPDGDLYLLGPPYYDRGDNLRGNVSPDANSQSVCAICIDNTRKCDFRLCCCPHAFHIDCLHAMPKKQCPLCRRKLCAYESEQLQAGCVAPA